jgi:hypothetical protein
MSFTAALLVGYVVLDRLLTLAMAGRGKAIEITWSFCLASFITGSIIVWGVLSLDAA